MQENSCEMRFLFQWYTPTFCNAKSSKNVWYFEELTGKLEAAASICFRTAESQGEARASWCRGGGPGGVAQCLTTLTALGRELNTQWGQDFRDNLLDNGFNTWAKGDRGAAGERDSLTSSRPWFSSRSQLLPVTQRESSKQGGLHELPSVKGTVRAQ